MPRFVGLDAHKKMLQIHILDAEATTCFRGRCPATREAIDRFATEVLDPGDHVVLEATTNTWALVDRLEPHVERVVVSNPLRTRAIAEAKVKTDKIDARILAELLRCDFLPEVWQPDAATRRLRRLTRRRAGLVGQRTGIKNRIHATLAQRLIEVSFGKLFSLRGLEWLRTLELDEDGRDALDSDLRLLGSLEEEIGRLDQRLAELAYQEQAVRLLMTLPGVDFTVAQGVVAAWGTIERFPSAEKAASYLGLVPSTYQSGDRCYHGRLTKQGNAQARWMLIQAAQHLDKNPGPLGAFFRRLMAKKNRNVAVVATARKMAVIAWHLLKNNEPYRYALPRSTEAKLSRLRVRATGEKRKGGNPKGSKRSARYGSGKPRRRIPGLDEVYSKENLPESRDLDELPQGERRALRALRVLDHARAVRDERFVAKSLPKT